MSSVVVRGDAILNLSTKQNLAAILICDELAKAVVIVRALKIQSVVQIMRFFHCYGAL